MTIKKKLQILEILFSTLDGEELSEADVAAALESLVQNPVKRAAYRRNMVEKYGAGIFVRRATEAGKSPKRKKGDG